MGFFLKAKPVWAENHEYDMNITCGFCMSVLYKKNESITLTVTGSSRYHIFINGRPYAYGPARCAHGFYRVDVFSLNQELIEGENYIAFEVTGYNINSFDALDQPSFLQAEIMVNQTPVAYTGTAGKNLQAFLLQDRIQKVQRYSFQRNFSECYSLSSSYGAWRLGGNRNINLKNSECNEYSIEKTVHLVETGSKNLVKRDLPPFFYPEVSPDFQIGEGWVEEGVIPSAYFRDRSLVNVGDKFKGFKEEELNICQSKELQEFSFTPDAEFKGKIPYYRNKELKISKNTYKLFSMNVEKTGFFCCRIQCDKPARLYITYDEVLCNGDINPLRQWAVASIRFELQAGVYEFQSAEPFGFCFLKFYALDADCMISNIHLREFIYPMPITKKYPGTDPEINKIYLAALETFRQNAVDVYLDCPTRERGGWLCDSFFTARVEYAITGESRVEQCFLQNFILPETFKDIPKGMLPMCYPADHYDGVFIPNWAMWFVLQLSEFYQRSGNRELIEDARIKVYALFDYFKPFMNELGMLENLENWIFIEWSEANKLTQDINFPTNMLYSSVLIAAGHLYNDVTLIQQGKELQNKIFDMSYQDGWFCDNAVRQNGQLILSGERTETCQYYAFFFNIATPESCPYLWNVLVENFGPHRDYKHVFSEIHPSNAFIGNYLRLDILSRYGYKEQVLNEVKAYFGYMAEKTGTLWENVTDIASCNHGFASYAADLILTNT